MCIFSANVCTIMYVSLVVCVLVLSMACALECMGRGGDGRGQTGGVARQPDEVEHCALMEVVHCIHHHHVHDVVGVSQQV